MKETHHQHELEIPAGIIKAIDTKVATGEITLHYTEQDEADAEAKRRDAQSRGNSEIRTITQTMRDTKVLLIRVEDPGVLKYLKGIEILYEV